MEYDERQKFEHELINRRVTWLLQSQSLLFAALAIALNGRDSEPDRYFFAQVISNVGIIISLLIFIGILAGVFAKYKNYRDERILQKNKRKAEFKERPLQWGVYTWSTAFALAPDVLMPLVFAFAWKVILSSL